MTAPGSTLVLVRHGQSKWNLENRFTGWVDVDLTVKGEDEARSAGQRLTGLRFDQAFCSVLTRAKRTLDYMLAETGQSDCPITCDAALNERMYGDLQGLNKDETVARFGAEQVHQWRRSYDIPPPGGESLKDTADRVIPYYEALIAPLLRSGQNILVVAHGNSLRALVMALEGLSPEQILQFELPTATPRVYRLDENLRVLSAEMI
ncbi:MAG: 2,3-bisphosphoglycerate-dependent phosphoglycerate mutase [Bacteroidota bacterium]